MNVRAKVLLALVVLMGVAVPAQADPLDCNALVSMSQGGQVYAGDDAGAFSTAPSELEALTGEEWMSLISGGKILRWWATAANWNTVQARHRCGTDAEIDSVLFIFDPRSPSVFPADLNSAISIMESRYPNAVIWVSLLVGGDGHVTCQVGGQNVKASQTHAQFIGQMTMPEAGPDLDIPCSGYDDWVGHLNDAGAIDAQAQVADWFNAQQEPELVIPPTIPHPPVGQANGYNIGVTDLTTNTLLWKAPYLHVTPYVESAGWQNGDRLAYHCAFGFHFFNGELMGRFSFRAVPTAANNPDGAYIRINDSFMEEAGDDQTTAGGPSRFFDGSINSTGMQGGGPTNPPFGECPQDVGVEYESGSFPDERPNVVFAVGNQVVELRDYLEVNAAPGVTFDLVEVTAEPFVLSGFPQSADHTVTSRVGVLARLNGDPVTVVYYDGLGNGRVLVEESE